MYFAGVDLAWSENNPTGVAVMESDSGRAKLKALELVDTDDEIVEAVRDEVGDGNCIVTVDAPLKVPNETGRRPAEEVVGKLFSSYDAGAHPANRQRLSQWTGRVRGEDIVERLEEEGFSHDPSVESRESCRRVVEVYPHPSMVALFDLDRILRYKKKSGREYETVYSEFNRFHSCMKELDDLEPPEILETDVTDMRGGELKRHEDLMDAVFCAYLGFYWWKDPERCKVLGNTEEGYILTPIKEGMEQELRSIRGQTTVESF